MDRYRWLLVFYGVRFAGQVTRVKVRWDWAEIAARGWGVGVVSPFVIDCRRP